MSDSSPFLFIEYNFMLLEISHFSLKRGLVALICISDLTEGVTP